MVPALRKHVDAIVLDGLRDQDRDEMLAMGRDPDDALLQSWEASWPNVWTIVADGVPVGMFGVAKVPAHGSGIAMKGGLAEGMIGAPWMLATPGLYFIVRDFVAQMEQWVDHMNNRYPILVNWVDERNTVSRRWLEKTGFVFDGAYEAIDDVKFMRFYRTIVRK